MNDMRAVVGDAEDLLKLTVNQTGDHIEKARERASESLRAARAQLQKAGQIANDQVRAHPWATTVIAAGVWASWALIGRR